MTQIILGIYILIGMLFVGIQLIGIYLYSKKDEDKIQDYEERKATIQVKYDNKITALSIIFGFVLWPLLLYRVIKE